MRIGIDLDGVCYDFVQALIDYAVECEGYRRDQLPYATNWDFFQNQWGWSFDEYMRVFGNGVSAGYIFWTDQPEPGCIEALRQLREQGHEVVIITHRDHKDPNVARLMKLATIEWLDQVGLPYDALMFTGAKTDRGIDIMFDDAPHNILAAQEAGEAVCAFDRPWNRDIESMRVYRWSDVPQLVAAFEEVRDLAVV